MRTINSKLLVWAAGLHQRLAARLGEVDETGGGRNTDEGFHISGGAIAAGVIVTAVGAFVAQKMGALN